MSNAFDHDKEYQQLPGIEAHARVDLGPIRTPLQRARRLGDELGIELYIKRDDCQPLGMGGNKVRQLEFYLGPAKQQQADTVLITGAIQSNFVRLCAAACRLIGFDPVVQLEDRVPTDDPLYLSSGNVLLDQLYGADIHYLKIGEDESAADINLDKLAEEYQANGRKPYVIHLGPEHPPIGSLGYALAAAELHLQLQQHNITPACIVTGSGSGITHAGLITGCHAINWDINIHGICVRRARTLQQPRIEKRINEVADLLGVSAPPVDKVNTHDDVLAPGYGQLNEQVKTAMQMAAHLEGLIVDPVYTGRALAGLIDLVNRGVIAKGESVVFIHTGGTPGIFAYKNKLDFL